MTGRPSAAHAGTGTAWLYARCVCPEMIASMFLLTPFTILPKSEAGSTAES